DSSCVRRPAAIWRPRPATPPTRIASASRPSSGRSPVPTSAEPNLVPAQARHLGPGAKGRDQVEEVSGQTWAGGTVARQLATGGESVVLSAGDRVGRRKVDGP